MAEVVVIGGGPAGIAAACRAAECGRSVVLLDEAPRPGGQIWRHRTRASLPEAARTWLARLEQSGARVVNGATVIDLAPGRVVAEQSGAPLELRPRSIVLCVGARERFLPFPGWTLPGVVGVGGGQALLKAGLVARGRRVAVAGSGPLLLPVAALFAEYGAQVTLVAEQTGLTRLAAFAAGLWRTPAKLVEAARYRSAFTRARYATGSWVTRAHGRAAVEAVELNDGRRYDCDLLCVACGLVPATELPRLAGCALEAGAVAVDELQRTSVADVYCAGETTGIGGVDAALLEGQIAGYAAAGAAERARALFGARDRYRKFARRLADAFALRAELKQLADADTIVCRCEDVRHGQLASYASLREAKLHTRAGMGPCQGRVCGSALQHLFGWSPDTVRIPAAAASVGTLATTE